MHVPQSIFREYDIRGIVDQELTESLYFLISYHFAQKVIDVAGPQSVIAVGRDCRLSSPRMQHAVVGGLISAGARVLDLGMVPTPLVSFAMYRLDAVGGLMVTGSHNPADWNGVKLSLNQQPFYGADIQALREIIEAGEGRSQLIDWEKESSTVDLDAIDRYTTIDPLPYYLDEVMSQLRMGSQQIKVVVDAGNGAAGPTALALYRRLGINVIPLYCTPDGSFPHHHPDPTVLKNLEDLRAVVHAEKATIGIAFDGDGDRIGVIDGDGQILWGDHLLLYLAEALLAEQNGLTIIGEVKCSQSLYDGITAAGGHAEMWKVGHSLIKARMKETGAALAGEMSGHIFYADRFFGYDDATYVGARLIELLTQGAERLEVWRQRLPTIVSTPELRVACQDEYKNQVVQRAYSHFSQIYPVSDIDGIRIQFSKGWGLIRASNTQPILVLRFEAETPEELDLIQEKVSTWFTENVPEVKLI